MPAGTDGRLAFISHGSPAWHLSAVGSLKAWLYGLQRESVLDHLMPLQMHGESQTPGLSNLDCFHPHLPRGISQAPWHFCAVDVEGAAELGVGKVCCLLKDDLSGPWLGLVCSQGTITHSQNPQEAEVGLVGLGTPSCCLPHTPSVLSLCHRVEVLTVWLLCPWDPAPSPVGDANPGNRQF